MPRIIAFLGYAPWTAPATFGEWLVMARRANGLSRGRLAKYLRVDQSTVFRWESGRCRPGALLLARVKAVLLSSGSSGSCYELDGRTHSRQRDQKTAANAAPLS